MNVVHEELAPHALTLMRDVFGNYIIQVTLRARGGGPRRSAGVDFAAK